jgi:hypothetical protein
MGLPGLSDAELMKALSYLGNDAAQAALARAMPLWYYVLCESFVDGIGGQSLGPVAGGILAEVVLGLLEGDPHSYLRQWPLWQPTLHDAASGVVPGTFTMADLVRFTER